MATNSKFELNSIIRELQSIINELDDVTEVIKNSGENIGNDKCAYYLTTIYYKYVTIKSKLNNVDTSTNS